MTKGNQIIYVREGEYYEKHIDMKGKRKLKIIGIGKEKVKILGNISIANIATEISGVTIVSSHESSPCVNAMGGEIQISDSAFCKGREGIMVQRLNDDKRDTCVSLMNCVFESNNTGIWGGLLGKVINVKGNIFRKNVFGIIDAGAISQDQDMIGKSNIFDQNTRADYASGWEYNDGTMNQFWSWNNAEKRFIEIQLPTHQRKR